MPWVSPEPITIREYRVDGVVLPLGCSVEPGPHYIPPPPLLSLPCFAFFSPHLPPFPPVPISSLLWVARREFSTLHLIQLPVWEVPWAMSFAPPFCGRPPTPACPFRPMGATLYLGFPALTVKCSRLYVFPSRLPSWDRQEGSAGESPRHHA